MKHPHCNRSLASHLFWCRGFAPTFFVIVVALFVVSVGSGFYFASRPDSALAPSEPIAVAEQKIEDIAASTQDAVVVEPVTAKPAVVVATPVAKPATAPVVAPKPVQAKPVDCGLGAAADACMFESIANCTPAKAMLFDERTGVRVEHVISGLVNGKCLYQSVIASAPGDFALLEGLTVRCLLPKEQLLQVVQEADEAELLKVCTGSYIDILRQARGMEPTAQ
ncbi:hypothetical protein A2524_00765 [Candidatus Wolfebacteria bacterium RIFOXYD12_FULL_48_21]|uniref:Uncharacterized protein n=1 Tax=Candidatus Wolfebacteria bacterium RIFOXYD1_FULL_48_65 TaxID=1802561 RepID=A0A1F8E027_9BACT|nr:MAG: hypothetical protein A2610_02710 [Candidatus Wolfebacteria bacterium RIFOXYD1_FULL_48_65]OGM94344.1 MAG: hypothetical protein A2524_00765 [Candidatus Wolfebacteria bacterium RIFOXYD12_FULL_48_21]OGM96967.1 MAG: hypothetical protein A2532_01455 [Candidatus Wolfebacteria bacterium RIFOXYD2_FULL_48_11]